jgi:aryl-alcohol dehydrogenase-like predicted oxidoreductase
VHALIGGKLLLARRGKSNLPPMSARTTQQLPDLIASATLDLTPDETAALDAASAAA